MSFTFATNHSTLRIDRSGAAVEPSIDHENEVLYHCRSWTAAAHSAICEHSVPGVIADIHDGEHGTSNAVANEEC